MRAPTDGWDDNERAVLAFLQQDFEAVRARHESDPPLRILRAARADVFPEELLTTEITSARDSRWGRALLEGLDTAEPPLTRVDEDRLLARIRHALRQGTHDRSRWTWRAWFVLGTAAALTLVVVLNKTNQSFVPTQPVVEQPAAAAPQVAPRFVLPLEKPDVKLSTAALTFRGSVDDDFVPQLTNALDAFRAGRFAEADRQLRALEKNHPVFDVYFYEGLSRLLVNDAAGAIPPLEKAATLADRGFAPDVAWYTAVAEERVGRVTQARDRVADLCRGRTPYARQACDGQKQLQARLPARPPS